MLYFETGCFTGVQNIGLQKRHIYTCLKWNVYLIALYVFMDVEGHLERCLCWEGPPDTVNLSGRGPGSLRRHSGPKLQSQYFLFRSHPFPDLRRATREVEGRLAKGEPFMWALCKRLTILKHDKFKCKICAYCRLGDN